MNVPSRSSDPARYWEERLSREFDLHGVGFQGLGVKYNEWMYRIRRSSFHRLLKRHPQQLSAAAALDIGSGTGFYVDLWLKAGARAVTGVDITEIAVTNLRQRFPSAAFVQADVGDRLPLPAHSFDWISAFDVMFHIVDDARFERAMHNIASHLKPEGMFAVTDHFVHGQPIRTQYEVIRPLDEVTAAAASAGLRVVDRFPVFSIMNSPIDSTRASSMLLWKLATGPARLAEPLGWLNGAALFPFEWLITRVKRESCSTELMVFQLS